MAKHKLPLSSKSLSPLLLQVGGLLAIVLVINGLIFGLGWNDGSSITSDELTPPGWLVGSIWLILFAIFGVLRYQLLSQPGKRKLLDILIAACALYPAYTAGLSNQTVALVGNVLTLVYAYVVFYKLDRLKLQLQLVPLLIWLTFATYITYINLPS